MLNNTSLLYAEPGTYYTRITSYTERKPANRQPYIEVEMNIGNFVVIDRWYANRLPYIMNCIRKQFHADYLDYTYSQLLKMAMNNPIMVHLSYHTQYGQQIDYKAA